MHRKLYYLTVFYLFLNPSCVWAWQHGVAVGYGASKEVEQSYDNSGVVLSGKIYRLPNIDEKLIPTIDGTLASIHSTATNSKHTISVALSLALRAYFQNPNDHVFRPYLQASFGPAYLSHNKLGNREQGSHFLFQSTLEAGSEIGSQTHAYDLNLRFIHYCNAGLAHPNQGINLGMVLSVGYLF